MPRVVMKNGEEREISDENMYSFLLENREQIQDQISPRKRPPLKLNNKSS